MFSFRTIKVINRARAASGDVEMNDEHSDYRWISENLQPFVREMIARSGIF